jgi:hypothetical protein
MPRIKSTIFRPILGATYVVINTKTNEKKSCVVLKQSDADIHGPVRSGRSCIRGKEFFKVFIDEKVYEMNNSIDNVDCLSYDGAWKFIDEKPEQTINGCQKPRQYKKKYNTTITKQNLIEYVSIKALSKITKG